MKECDKRKALGNQGRKKTTSWNMAGGDPHRMMKKTGIDKRPVTRDVLGRKKSPSAKELAKG